MSKTCTLHALLYIVTQGFQINFTYSKKYQNKSNMKKRKIRNIMNKMIN